MTEQSNNALLEQFAYYRQLMTPGDRRMLDAHILGMGSAANIGEELMKRRTVRLLFTFLVLGVIIGLFILAPYMPREMVAAALILGFALAIVAFILWMARDNYHH